MTKARPAAAIRVYLLWSALAVLLLFGSYTLWLHNDVLPWIYTSYVIGHFVIFFLHHKELSALFDRHILFGKKSQELFSRETSWTLLFAVPTFFLAVYLDWKMLALYTIMIALWHTLYLISTR